MPDSWSRPSSKYSGDAGPTRTFTEASYLCPWLLRIVGEASGRASRRGPPPGRWSRANSVYSAAPPLRRVVREVFDEAGTSLGVVVQIEELALASRAEDAVLRLLRQTLEGARPAAHGFMPAGFVDVVRRGARYRGGSCR